MLGNPNCSDIASKIFDEYLLSCKGDDEFHTKYFKYSLSSKAEVELIFLMVELDCPENIKDFFWLYAGYSELDQRRFFNPFDSLKGLSIAFRYLSNETFSKLVECLENKNYRDTAYDIILRYFGSNNIRCVGVARCILPENVKEFLGLLKKADCLAISKNLLLMCFKDINIQFFRIDSVYIEESLILLLWNKNYRDVGMELLLCYAEHHKLLNESLDYFKGCLFLARIFKTKACYEELTNFYRQIRLLQ